MADEPTPDAADKAAFRWRVEDKAVKVAREAADAFDLNPSLVDALERAEQEQDFDAFEEAVVDLLEAVVEAKEERDS